MAFEANKDLTVTERGSRHYELHLSPELEERFLRFFTNQSFHTTPSELLVVVVRNGLKVLETRKRKAGRK